MTTVKEARALTTADVERRLFAKYHGADFAICMGVRNAAGLEASRECDAMGIGLWPSRGCHLHGFEIKVSRADWLRELKEGAKAEAFHAYCDFWHLVVGDRAIVQEGELPAGWGLLVPHGDTLREIVAPAKIDAAPMPRSMLAAFVKRAATQAPLPAMLSARYDAGLNDGIERGKQMSARENDNGPEYRSLRDAADRFKKETGIDVQYMYDASQLRAAMAIVAAGRTSRATINRFEHVARDLRQMADSLTKAATTLNEQEPLT